MTEFPPRSCGPCPHMAHFEAKQDPKNYIQSNTIPPPQVRFQEPANPTATLGTTSPFATAPDLNVSPLCAPGSRGKSGGANAATMGRDIGFVYEPGGMPPCKEADAKGVCRPCLQRDPDKPDQPCPKSPYHLAQVEESYKTFKLDSLPEGGNVESGSLKGILKKTDSIECECAKDQGQVDEMRAHGEETTSAAPPMPQSAELKSSPEPNARPPCYLPQPGDDIPVTKLLEMGPTGPWATGRVDWGPIAGLTGTRPIVDGYSIARYSEGEWRGHNKEVLDGAGTGIHKANLIEWNGRQCLEQSQADADKNQEDNTKRLRQREKEIHRWKCELERAIAAATEEVENLEMERRRLKQASAVLQMPESISGECLERRTGRLDSELVRDELEEELIKERSLCAEIKEQFMRTLKDVEAQFVEDKTAKQRLEFDWSDKSVSHELDSLCAALTLQSTVLMFKPGAVVLPENQSSYEYWVHFTKETLQEAEATRQRSAALRSTLSDILTNAARDLRAQGDRVELALTKRVKCTDEVLKKMENDLKNILQKLADVERLIIDLRACIRRLDCSLKKAQTRLDNRLKRPRVESCRDDAQFGLVDEVKELTEKVAALQGQLRQAEDYQSDLITTRNNLEKEIMYKRKTMEIDGFRIQKIRSYYPSATALSGYT